MLSVKLKCENDEQVRRIVLENENFEQLVSSIQSLYGKPVKRLTYIDDEGDTISLRSSSELGEAIRLARNTSSSATLRLFVQLDQSTPNQTASKVDETPSHKADTQTNPCQAEASPNSVESPDNSQAQEQSSQVNEPNTSDDKEEASKPNASEEEANKPKCRVRVFAQPMYCHPAFASFFHQIISEQQKKAQERAENKDGLGALIAQALAILHQTNFNSVDKASQLMRVVLEAVVSGSLSQVRPMQAIGRAFEQPELIKLLSSLFRDLCAQTKANSAAKDEQSKQAEESKANSEAMHNAQCDECGERIKGVRYKCLTCDDFDLCQQCESSDEHHTTRHHFVKIRSPQPPSAAFAPANRFQSRVPPPLFRGPCGAYPSPRMCPRFSARASPMRPAWCHSEEDRAGLQAVDSEIRRHLGSLFEDAIRQQCRSNSNNEPNQKTSQQSQQQPQQSQQPTASNEKDLVSKWNDEVKLAALMGFDNAQLVAELAELHSGDMDSVFDALLS